MAVSSTRVSVSVDIKNTGTMDGAEVIQVWIGYSPLPAQPSRFARPVRALACFAKPFLKVGEQKSVVIPIPRDSTSVWDEKRSCWCEEKGTYTVSVVTGSGQGELQQEMTIERDSFWSGL